MSAAEELRFEHYHTVFLDAGNTLVAMDLERVAGALAERGLVCTLSALRRAEAAARPSVSARLELERGTENRDSFTHYLGAMLAALPHAPEPAGVAELAAGLSDALREPGRADRLWRTVLPGVPEALAELRRLDVSLVVVSNSDGSVERGLADQGLRHFFDHVVDSHVAGFQKPDQRIFEHALARSGADPSRTLHVGDLFAADVVGARAAGIDAVLLDPFGDWPEADCPRVPDVPELARRFAGARA
jgi:putative hydrolase of the HAD superfamily